MLQMTAGLSAAVIPSPPLACRWSAATDATMTDVAHDEDPRAEAPPAPPDPEMLRALVVDHSEAVYRVALSVVRDPALAEDVSQETLIKAWQALPTFRGDAPLRSWILRIAHNQAISTLRKRRDVLRDPAELPDRSTEVTVERNVEGRAALASFEAALDQLDELSRSIVVLRELEHLSYEDIAETLDVPLPTVKTRLLRARRVLAAALGEWRP